MLWHDRKSKMAAPSVVVAGFQRLPFITSSIHHLYSHAEGYLIIGVQITVILVSSDTGTLQVFGNFGSGKLAP